MEGVEEVGHGGVWGEIGHRGVWGEVGHRGVRR